eukprot:TRINITY_DN9270_c0_g1_i1.p2 TRINITY_DN9270_c0_g1~~TRINITY_DN9270_c0_g1_i1.p2  ORF type:complete len:226 (-),score=83.63 TRINITY_DN9270_c0_g1_i1:94-771(-)
MAETKTAWEVAAARVSGEGATQDTPATRQLDASGAAYRRHAVAHEDVRQGESLCGAFARQLDAPPAQVLKTMVFGCVPGDHLNIVVMHGDRKIDTKALTEVLVAYSNEHKRQQPQPELPAEQAARAPTKAGQLPQKKKNQAQPKQPQAKLAPQELASQYTGYVFGGTSPFGVVREADMHVFVERTILDADTVWVNGGSPTLVLQMATQDFVKALGDRTTLVSVAQ